MRAPRAEVVRRLRPALLPAALLALAPKCALCLLAYAGLGAALGLGGPELCGGSVAAPSPAIPLLFGLGLGAWLVRKRRRARPGGCTAGSLPALCASGPDSPRR